MSYIQITFSGASDISDALMYELVSQDVFPTVNSGIAQISQYVGDQGGHRYEITFETSDDNALRDGLRSYVENNYPSITLDGIISVVAPEVVETGAPSVIEVQPGEVSDQ